MLNAWKWYQRCMSLHPVKTQVISSGILWGVGDITAQSITHSSARKRLQISVSTLHFKPEIFFFFSVIVFVTLFCLIVGASGYLECPFVGLKFLVFCDGYPWFLYFSTQDAFYSVEIHCFLGWVSFIFVIQHAGCPFIPLKIITESVIFGDFLMEFLFGLCRFCTGIVIFVDESWTYLFILIFQVVKQKKIGDDAIHSFLCFPPLFLLRLFLWSFSTTVLGIFPTFHLVPFSSLFLCTLLGWLVHIAVLMEHWCWILDLFN